jgi:lipoprotein-anchoring transpeptidase ErfK/SrfK
MGASLNTRRHLKTDLSTLPSISFQAFAHPTITAGATMVWLAGFASAAHALPMGQPSDVHTIIAPRTATERPAVILQRAVPARNTTTASLTKGKEVNKATAVPAELGHKASGPLRVLISLDKQQLTLYAGDDVIARSRVSSGQKGRSTPTGVFSIIQKDRRHHSNLYDDAPMYFMQRLTWSGVALHQGIVPNYPASHGCVRLPEAFAQKLWGTTKVGARVIITHGEIAPMAIAHPKLFAPKAAPAVSSNSLQNSLQAAEKAWQLALLDNAQTMAWSASDASPPRLPAIDETARARATKRGAVSVFISRKAGKLYVRQGFEPVFDMPVTIDQPNAPLGTHVFTALDVKEQKVRWSVVSASPKTSAAAALDRITIPPEAMERVSELMSAGSSLIISDQGLGSETGPGTDFVVVNP